MLKPLALALFILTAFVSEGSAQIKRYDVLSYSGAIELDRQDTFIRGHVKMNAVCTTGAPVDRILQHLIYLDIDSVLVNGVRATIDWTGMDSGEYYVVPPASMVIPGYFTVETFFHGKPLPEQNSGKWGGVSNRGGMFFAMGVGFQAPYISCTRHWLPSYDLPDDKADSARFVFVAKDAGDVVAASGRLERVFDTLGGKGYDWHVVHPIATYLMTFAQGPFIEMNIQNPLQIPFETYSFAADTTKVRRLMDRRVVRGLQFFDSLFHPYPFEKVGYVVAPIGSMEHQTMVTLDRRTLDTNNTTAIHELAHMWWGDLVTCHTFADPWLNEGFATFSESLYLERFEGKQAYKNKQWANIQSAKAKGSDYPMYGAPYHTGHTNNYPSAVIYDKGAAVLGMLRHELHEPLFFYALRSYLAKYKYLTATSYDLREHFKNATSQDFTYFFDQWVFGKGYPKFEITWNPNQLTFITARQTSPEPYFKVKMMVEATAADGRKARYPFWTNFEELTQVDIDFGLVPVSLVFDPDSVLIADIKVERADVERKHAMSIKVWPNPSSKGLIRLEGLPRYEVSAWSLVDTGGKRVLWGQAESEKLDISLETLASGSYRLVIESNGEMLHSEQVVYQP